MSKDIQLFSQKQLKQLIRKRKQDICDQISYDDGEPFFNLIMKEVGESPTFILQEIVAKAIKDVVDEDARIDFSSRQISFMEYGEKWIKLPDKITVPVKKASLQHLRFQEQTIVREHVKQMKAFITHHENLLVPLIKAMEDNQFETAGEAIHYLMR